MRLPVYRPPDAQVLWRVVSFGRQRTPAGRPYWWENRGREPVDTVVIQATREGSILLRDRFGEAPCGPGSIALFVYGEDSAYGQPEPLREPYRCAWFNVQGAGLRDHVDAFRGRHGSVRTLGPEHPLLTEHDELVALAEPHAATKPTALAHAIHAFIMRLFEHAENSRMEALPPVEQAIEHVLRHPHLPLSLDQIADRFGVSREHLSRAFRDRVGKPPGVYLAEAKQRRAVRLLRETDLPLAAVAEQAGYATTHTMARQLREALGRSPTQLRAERHARPAGTTT